MKNTRHLLLLMFLVSVITQNTYSQEVPADDRYKNVREKDKDQLDDYLEGEYLFPPQPKNNLSLGVKAGLAFISGDVNPRPGAAFGIDLRKALGHVFSLRFQTTIGQTKGLRTSSTNGYQNHVGNPWNELYFRGQGLNSAPRVFYNYRMRYGDFGLQGVVNLNNINFYKEQNKWNIYAAAGIGVMAYNTVVNALDANGLPYDFSDIISVVADPNEAFSKGEIRRNTIDALKDLLDDTYETQAERHLDEEFFRLGDSNDDGEDDPYTVNPMLTGALGIRYRVNRRIEIEVEHRITWTNDDLLDGQRWSEQGTGNTSISRTALTRDFDSYSHTTLGVHFRLGKGEESLWWNNPLSEVYSKAQEGVDIVRKLELDQDSDGVPDLYDKEPDTPEGAIVDSQGRTQDIDGDGFPDSEDDQPFTPKGCPVDNRGVALDSDADGVADCFDKEPNSAPGVLVDAKGITIPTTDTTIAATPCVLPIIHFDLNKADIKPEFFPELYYIAQVMKGDPGLKILATGFTDVRASDEYNLKLSERRVNNAIDFISNTYGIDRSRFNTDFKGESDTLIPDLPDNKANRKLEPLHYVNRRVEFECINQ